MTTNEKRLLKVSGFARSNGRVLCAINILRIKYNKLAGVKNVLKGEGVAEDEFLDAVNFLAEEGYIHLRRTSTGEEADLADCDYTALEAKLTGKGIRLRAGDVKDDMVSGLRKLPGRGGLHPSPAHRHQGGCGSGGLLLHGVGSKAER